MTWLALPLLREALLGIQDSASDFASDADLVIGIAARDPDSLKNNVTRLVGTKESRLRIGDWRVIYRVDGDNLLIMKIAPRGGAYV